MGEREEFNPPEWGKKMRCACFLPQRIVLAIFGFLCVFCIYLPRIGLSHAVTVMVIKKNKTIDKSAIICPMDESSIGGSASANKGEFHWSEKEQGFLLAAFFIGYIVSHLPGGFIADKFGAKWVLIFGLFGTTVTTLLSPPSAYLCGVYGLATMRAFLGVAQGVVFPALSSWIANWIPPNERGRVASIVLSGNILGSVITNAWSGLIVHHFDWPVLFYFYGTITGLWVITVIPLCKSYPVDHPCITEKEIEYLRTGLGHIGPVKKPSTPWKKFVKSCPVWALIIGTIGHDWGFYVIVTDLPKYMADVLNMKPTKNGLVTAMPFICLWIVIVISAFIGDFLINRGYVSLDFYRKLATIIGNIGPGVFMVLASYAGCNEVLVVIMFCLAMATMGTYYTGARLTPIDMSPNFAGILMAVANGIGSITGFIAPTFIGFMTPNTTVLEWRIVFWVSLGILIFTTVIFVIFGRSEVQPFDSSTTKEEPK